MKLLLLVNNFVGLKITEWLLAHEAQIAGLVIHPPAKRKYIDDLLNTMHFHQNLIFDGSQLRNQKIIEEISNLRADLAVSIFFDYILCQEFIDLFPQGVINLHPSYLPYNRGQYPNVWSIIEGTPAGVTLHHIDQGIDTGDIIAQRLTAIDPIDTGETLYRKLEQDSIELFKESWPLILSGNLKPQPQQLGVGITHRSKDVDQIDFIDLEKTYSARYLIDILRARTFAPYRGAYIKVGDRKIYLRLQLLSEDDL